MYARGWVTRTVARETVIVTRVVSAPRVLAGQRRQGRKYSNAADLFHPTYRRPDGSVDRESQGSVSQPGGGGACMNEGKEQGRLDRDLDHTGK